MHFFFEFILPLDIDFSAVTAELLFKEAEHFWLNCGVNLVTDVEVGQGHERFQPSSQAFNNGNFFIDKNPTIFEQQKVDNESFFDIFKLFIQLGFQFLIGQICGLLLQRFED